MSSAVPDVHQISVSTVDTRGRVRTRPLITMSQGFRPSPNVDAVATVNHAFLCMDIHSCVIAPRLIGYASDTPASSFAVSTVYGSCTDGEPYTNQSSYACWSAPVSQPDMPVYHHTALRGTGSFRSSGPHARSTAVSSASTSTTLPGAPLSYLDIGDCDQFCRECGALFWLGERLKNHNYNSRPEYHLCCGGGRIYMPIVPDSPPLIQQLLTNSRYMEHIRAYNQMFAMTSFGAKVDDTVNRGSGPYVFKVSGQVYHWMGSLCPEDGNPPRFLQLYIYDTRDEVQNRMRHFGGRDDTALSADIVDGLIRVLDEHNGLVRLFRMGAPEGMNSKPKD